ncbi:MAG: DUF2851 family protein [Chitinophagales bacterium]|nr:DUF2851 family protein [Chitinophagales bacterium]
MLTEELLHFVWKFRLYRSTGLATTTGESIEVINPGTHNTHAGADFTDAKIKIGGTLWVGNIEIHPAADDWFAHGHHTDAGYNNTILHVVYSPGKKTAQKQNGTTLPVLVLNNAIPQELLSRYAQLLLQKKSVPCSALISQADKFTIQQTIERAVIERLQQKVQQIETRLQRYNNDWEQILFIQLARYLGASVNKDPMQWLAEKILVKTMAKHAGSLLQIEAMLFGTAGLLHPPYDDEYARTLQKEFMYLKRLHRLDALQGTEWKYLRLRPANFPTLRIAQLAALLQTQNFSFSKILDCTSVAEIENRLQPQVSEYWKTHYQFDKPSKQVRSSLGESMKQVIIINAIVPVLFAYGKYKQNDTYCDRALQLLEDCTPEGNSIIKQWNALGISTTNSYQTQGLLQLKNEHCDKFRCLQCGIGLKILKQ